MVMKRPPKLTKEQLEHPKADTYVAWNGDVRKKRSTRWNGSPDMEDRGFVERGLVTVTSKNLDPTPWNHKPGRIHAVQPHPNGGRVNYSKPIGSMNDLEKVLAGHWPSIRRWRECLAEGEPLPYDVAIAMHWCGHADIYLRPGDD